MIKKIILTIVSLLLVAAIGIGIYAFAFDKKIPSSWVSGQIESVKESKLTEDDKMPSLKVLYEKIVYTKDGDKTIETYGMKYYRELKNKSTKDVESYEVFAIDYDSEGKEDEKSTTKYYIEDEKYYRDNGTSKVEIENFNEVGMFFLFVADYYKEDMTFKDEVIDLIDNNLDYVSQKGFNITLHMHTETEDLKKDFAITYSLTSKKVVKLEITSDTYVDNVLTSRTHERIEY